MNGWWIAAGYVLCGLIVAKVLWHATGMAGDEDPADAFLVVMAFLFWPVGLACLTVAGLGWLIFEIVAFDPRIPIRRALRRRADARRSETERMIDLARENGLPWPDDIEKT